MAGTKRRCTPIVIGTPQVVPISEEDYRQAVTALAVMIHDWWINHCDSVQPEPDAGERRDADPAER